MTGYLIHAECVYEVTPAAAMVRPYFDLNLTKDAFLEATKGSYTHPPTHQVEYN